MSKPALKRMISSRGKGAADLNPMDFASHEAIIEDMLESPQWTDGSAGILVPSKPLCVTLSRNTETLWVHPDFHLHEHQAFDIFYAFLCMRELYQMQHPEIGPFPFAAL